LYGDRPLYFFMLFPMPARWFVLLLGGIELVSSMFYSNAGVAHLAHLGGMLTGVVFLAALARWRQRMRSDLVRDRQRQERQQRLQKAGHLKLVRGREGGNDDDGPAGGRWN
ncbi:MAG: rhomboid family intramembrane serine protease, partial [Bdellovibrionales bacterium]|nr:rhomboid family intramembrane serine protease [Bdellovibrionales bacterium]